MNRHGISQALEAVIAAILLLSFAISVLPTFGSDPATIPTTTIKARETLTGLDAAGELRPLVADRNLSGIKQQAAPYFPAKQTAVAVRWVNATARQHTFSGSVTDTVAFNESTMTRAVLRVWYRDGHAVNVTVNGASIVNHTGGVNGVQESFPVTAAVEHGSNTVTLNATGDATVDYTLTATHEQLSAEPGSGLVQTGSYLLPGVNSTFRPTEVTLLVW